MPSEASYAILSTLPGFRNSSQAGVYHFGHYLEANFVNCLFPLFCWSPAWPNFKPLGLGGCWEPDFAKFRERCKQSIRFSVRQSAHGGPVSLLDSGEGLLS